MDWQPIETAPKAPVLLFFDPDLTDIGGVVEAWWEDDSWQTAFGAVEGPTHWAPLPPAPSATV